MRHYRVKLRAVEPWFFGTERNLGFGRGKLRAPYFVRSKRLPAQTTLLGSLRWLLLKQNAQLSADYTVNAELIGEQSFDMQAREQSFGMIREIGPLMITDREDNLYIPCPFDASPSEGEYRPYSLKPYEKGFEKDAFILENFDAKTHSAGEKFLRLPSASGEDVRILHANEIFFEKNKTRIHKKLEEEGFFKQTLYGFRSESGEEPSKDFAFCFDLSVDENLPLLRDDLVFMGGGKSCFAISFEEKQQGEELEEKVERALSAYAKEEYDIYYVLSDTCVDEEVRGHIFSINQQEFFRNLRTEYDKAKVSEFKERYRSSEIYSSLVPGSLFYCRRDQKDFVLQFADKNRENIGMNRLIKITKGER